MIDKFLKSKRFSDLQFIQYYKGFELLRRWTMKHHSQAVDFSNLTLRPLILRFFLMKPRSKRKLLSLLLEGMVLLRLDQRRKVTRTRLSMHPEETSYLFIFFETLVASLF